MTFWVRKCQLRHFYKITCLVTLFNHKIQVFKNSLKWTIFGIFNELLYTQIANLARSAHHDEWDFYCDFQTPCILYVMTTFNSYLLRFDKFIIDFSSFDNDLRFVVNWKAAGKLLKSLLHFAKFRILQLVILSSKLQWFQRKSF